MHNFIFSLTWHQMGVDVVKVVNNASLGETDWSKFSSSMRQTGLMLLMLYTPVGDTNWALPEKRGAWPQHIQDVYKVQLLVKRWKEGENRWTGISCGKDLTGWQEHKTVTASHIKMNTVVYGIMKLVPFRINVMLPSSELNCLWSYGLHYLGFSPST